MQSILPRKPAKPPLPIRRTNQSRRFEKTSCIFIINIYNHKYIFERLQNMASDEGDLLSKSLEYAVERLKLSSFKELQSKAIKSAVKGEDVFVNLPTDYGKSAIFQAISLCKDFFVRTTTVAASTPSPSASTPEAAQSSGAYSHRTALSIEVIVSPLISLMKECEPNLSHTIK